MIIIYRRKYLLASKKQKLRKVERYKKRHSWKWANLWVLRSKTRGVKRERFNISLRLFNFWFWGISAVCQIHFALKLYFEGWTTAPKRLKRCYLYRRCFSEVLSVCDSTAVNSSMSTKDTNNDSQPYQCLSVAIQIIFGANWLKRKVEVTLDAKMR